MSNEALGGYLGLELKTNKPYHGGAQCIELNTARNSLEYILKTHPYTKVYIPYFTCDVLIEPFRKLGISYIQYAINDKLEPVFDFAILSETDAFLYTNYFGIKDSYIDTLSQLKINLIIDNAQSFFSKPIPAIPTFYSARKFIGVADGAYLYSQLEMDEVLEVDKSYRRMEHLLRRIDESAESGYTTFLENDHSLDNQAIKRMSLLTQKILASVDYSLIIEQRISNFDFLNNNLEDLNLLKIEKPSEQVPMTYPFRTKDMTLRKKLLDHRVYCATYWPNVVQDAPSKESLEYQLANEIIHLPIDQRIRKTDLEKILFLIKNQ